MARILDVNDGFSAATSPTTVGLDSDDINYTQGDTNDWTTADGGAITLALDEAAQRLIDLENSVNVGSVTKTANYTVTTTDELILVDASGAVADVTMTLFAASGNEGKTIWIKRIDNDYDFDVVIDANASETIDGALTNTLWSQYDFVQLQCDGSNWHVISKHEGYVGMRATTDAGDSYTSAWTTVAYEDLDFDTHGGYNVSGIYTARADGRYRVVGTAAVATVDAGRDVHLGINFNGEASPLLYNRSYSSNYNQAGAERVYAAVSDTVQLTKGQTVNIDASMEVTENLQTTANNNVFFVEKIGD